MDVPAPFAGKIAELKVSVGDEVSEGSVLMTVEPSEDGDQGAEVATSAAPASAAEAAEEQEGGRHRRHQCGRGARAHPG